MKGTPLDVGKERPGGLAQEIFARQPHHRDGPIVGVGVPPLEIERDEGVGDARQHAGDLGPGVLRLLARGLGLDARRLGAGEQLLPLLFGGDPPGHILEDAQEVPVAERAGHRHRPNLDEPDRAVRMDEAVDRRRVSGARLDRRSPARHDLLAILGVQRAHPSPPLGVGRGEPEDPLPGGVDVQALAARARQEDPERRGLAGGAEARLAGRQRLIDPTALDRAGHPLRDHLQQHQILLLAERAGGGGESGDADQEAVHQDGDQGQRTISVGRDQLLDRPAQELAGARQPQHPAPLQIGQERGREQVERQARVLRDVAERAHLGRMPLVGQLDRSAASSRR